MSDRLLRQLGFEQDIPLPPIAPSKCRRGKGAQGYSTEYSQEQMDTFGWGMRERRLISIEDRTRAINGWDVTDDYLDWFLPRTHPRLDPRSGTTQMPEPVPKGPHAVDHLRVCIRLNYRFFWYYCSNIILYFIAAKSTVC